MAILELQRIGYGSIQITDQPGFTDLDMSENKRRIQFSISKSVTNLLSVLLIIICFTANAQLKFVVEDFEGFADGVSDLKENGVFTYGNIKATVDYQMSAQQAYSGERFLRVYKDGKTNFGGWGKGVTLNIELDPTKDYFNFYVYQQGTNGSDSIKIELQDDDNGDNTYEKESDDSWTYLQKIDSKNTPVVSTSTSLSVNPVEPWQLISIPLNKFKDSNTGGDGIFNINYKQGKLLTFIISFINADHVKTNQTWSFDFICFSQGKLSTGPGLFDAPPASPDDFCNLGVFSMEGNTGNFIDIASGFENNLKYGSEKKLGVVHFFQPFSTDENSDKKHYPSAERINKIIQEGYIPMITLEDHFPIAKSTVKQPNLYSIVEGHYDSFFADWAKQIKKVNGIVLLRILHEFNGDWYPWCIANNDKNPQLVVKAFRHIHDIFKAQQVTNVKFIWCPNSMSFPQEKWNFIMDAYPGDEYVDFVGLDIYNGAGKSVIWRSFRKEGIENYFILTQRLANKPLFICETASRERNATESKSAQDKAGWIKQMSIVLTSDMSKIKLLTWFNEKETFKISSSPGAQGAYLDYIFKNDYFKSGTKYMEPLLGH